MLLIFRNIPIILRSMSVVILCYNMIIQYVDRVCCAQMGRNLKQITIVISYLPNESS